MRQMALPLPGGERFWVEIWKLKQIGLDLSAVCLLLIYLICTVGKKNKHISNSSEMSRVSDCFYLSSARIMLVISESLRL
jgi:hypothetical protein